MRITAPYADLTAVMYTFYLYFSFSGYSEISRATGLVLRLDLPENFKTVLRHQLFRLLEPLAHLVFFLAAGLSLYAAGLGRSWPLWPPAHRAVRVLRVLCFRLLARQRAIHHLGLLQAVYRMGEELLHRRFGKPKKRGTPARVLWGKRVVVFVLWTISMVFFRVGSGNLSGMAENLGVGDAFVYLGRCLMSSWSPARFAGELYSYAVSASLRHYHYGSAYQRSPAGAGAWHLAGSPAQFCLQKQTG